MDNFFITKHPYNLAKNKPYIKLLNTALRFIKVPYIICSLPAVGIEMNTIEQRINYFHLLESVIANKIEGDVVELGCFTGQCAILFQKVIELNESKKKLHLFDSFQSSYMLNGSVEAALKRNFIKAGLMQPALHKGDFQETIPAQLPVSISFVHIDCGSGNDFIQHKETMTHCLESIYPRLSKGAICVLMDYHDSSINNTGFDANPAVKLSIDEFLETKPEKMVSIYGNCYSHGFFRKLN